MTKPFVHLASGEERTFRYVDLVRFGSLIGIPLGLYWLIGIAQRQDLFVGNRLLQGLLAAVASLLVVGPLLMWSQVYVISERGITSHNLFRRAHVAWEAIEWVSLDRTLLGGQRYCIYTARSRRWAYPRLAIPSWVRGFDELVFVIREKVLAMKGP